MIFSFLVVGPVCMLPVTDNRQIALLSTDGRLDMTTAEHCIMQGGWSPERT